MRRSQVRIPSLAPGKHDGSDAIVSGQSCFFFMGKGVFYEPPKLAETLIDLMYKIDETILSW